MRLVVFLLSGLLLATSPTHAIDFDHDVIPILRQHCVECHGDNEAKGGFSINSRELFLESEAAVPGDVGESYVLELVKSDDPEIQMPPENKPRLTDKEKQTLVDWIAADMPWTAGFRFDESAYQAPLLPTVVELPGPSGANPIDQLLGQRIEPTDDGTFLRRATLDLIGLLPQPDTVALFVADRSANKRQKLIDDLLARETEYTEHWLSFYNDLFRNDYDGTGFITGGRKQISNWLYASLMANKPFDQMTRELIAPPSDESRGFIDGITWRGTVSAGQTNEIQFAQSVAQSFMGINLKCASCHDSFIDRWKLTDAYALAAIYANEPLKIHRCDKPTGETAEAGWLYPELGEIDKNASQSQRLEQLAALVTAKQNGRFARTIVNRLWAQLMGRGIVHPLDAMHTEPWNADLLDYLANHLVEQEYDLKAVLRLIATSDAYQSRSEVLDGDPATETNYVYAGRRAKRMTAEQFIDSVWQLTGAAPSQFDAPIQRNAEGSESDSIMVRAGLLKADFLMRSLGRPNRDQIVTSRPVELTTLEAIDLANGKTFAKALEQGATHLAKMDLPREEMIQYLFRFALARDATTDELETLSATLGEQPVPQSIEDVLWAVCMMPEFLMVR